MNDPDPQQEPSMEEILASIRRIISEDDTEGGPPADAAPAEPVPEPVPEPAPEPEPEPVAAASGADVLDLTDEVQNDGTVVNLDTGRSVDDGPASEVVELELKDVVDGPAIMADETVDAASDAMSSLVNVGEGGTTRNLGVGGRSIEDMVREMVRPLLKEWLDANLPGMVERMVASEIDRVSKRVQR